MMNLSEALEFMDNVIDVANMFGGKGKGAKSVRNFITAQAEEIERLKEELDTFRKPCSVCGGSGYRDINKTVSAKEPVIGVHIEHQRVKCPHCKDGFVDRMIVSEIFVNSLSVYACVSLEAHPENSANLTEIYIVDDVGQDTGFKLTRLSNGMWEISEVTE